MKAIKKMYRMLVRLIVHLFVFGLAGSAFANPIYVSLDGNDESSGKLNDPVRTIEQARDLVRAWKSINHRNRKEPIIIFIRKGVYSLKGTLLFDERDSGVEGAPVIYRSFPGEAVRIIGGKVLDTGDCRKLMKSDYKGRLQDSVRKIAWVLELDLDEVMLDRDFSWEREKPGERVTTQNAPEEVFVDHEPLSIARWPNAGWYHTEKIIHTGSAAGDMKESGGSFIIKDQRIAHWRSDDVWMNGFWKWGWFDEALPVSEINRKDSLVNLARSHHYGLGRQISIFAFNDISELDHENEYFLDREKNQLVFLKDVENGSFELSISLLKSPIVSVQNTKFIHFVGLNFELGRNHGVVIRNSADIEIRNTRIGNTGMTAVVIENGYKIVMSHCDVFNAGTRGIVVSGGDRKRLKAGLNTIQKCTIRKYARRLKTINAGIDVYGVGNTVSQNRIENSPHMGIRINGNDNKIVCNFIKNVCRTTSDAGAIYMGRDWTARGNIIRRNYITHIRSDLGKGDVSAIYLDDAASGAVVEENIIRNVHRGFLIGGGRDNRIIRNIVVETDIPLHVDARGLRPLSGNWKDHIMKRLTMMPYESEPWRSMYPNLAGILNDNPWAPKGNIFRENLMYKSGKSNITLLAKPFYSPERNTVADTDPGFADIENDDLRLLTPENPIGFGGLRPEYLLNGKCNE